MLWRTNLTGNSHGGDSYGHAARGIGGKAVGLNISLVDVWLKTFS